VVIAGIVRVARRGDEFPRVAVAESGAPPDGGSTLLRGACGLVEESRA